MADLALDADIHLHRAWALVLGSEQRHRKAHVPGQEVPDKVRVGSLEVEWVERLVLLLEGDQARSGVTDRDILTAELLIDLQRLPAIDGNRLRLALSVTGVNHLIEGAGAQTQGSIKQDVVVDHVLVEQPDTATNHSLAVALRIPGKTNLWSKILVGLSYWISIPRIGGVDFGDGGQVTVGTPRVAVPAQAGIYREIGLHLPGVPDIKTDPVVRPQPARRKT